MFMQQIFNQTDGLCNGVSSLASMEYPFKIYSVSEDSYTRACTNESRRLVFKGRDGRLFIRQSVPQSYTTDAKRLQISSN